MTQARFVTIEGNIGAGKTTLSTMLAGDLSAYLLLEQFIDNPFLPKFYQDKERYGFSVETAFLAERYRQFHDEFIGIDLKKQSVISDYSFYKSLIFAGQTLEPDEFGLFSSLFGIIHQNLPHAQVFVYLHTPLETLLHQIKKRGRAFESQIDHEYLKQIEKGYFKFMNEASGLKCLLIHTEGADFVRDPSKYSFIKELISQDFKYGITEVSLSKESYINII